MNKIKWSLLAVLICGFVFSCQRKDRLIESEKSQVKREATTMLHQYHEAIAKGGLKAEFDYLDSSDAFFWLPPGFSSALNYDSVRTILESSANAFQSVAFKWKSLEVNPLSKNYATFSGTVEGKMIDTSGVENFVLILESGTLIKGQGGWKLLSGQSVHLEPDKNNNKVNKKMNCILQTPTNSIEESLNFYNRLQFKVLSLKNPTVVTDGKAIIEINENRYARAGVKIYSDKWSDIISVLNELVTVKSNDNGYYFADPSGMMVYLIEGPIPIKSEEPTDPFSALGNYAGVSLETTDMAKSTKLWESLGFEIKMGGPDQGWIVLEDVNGFSISFMNAGSCPHLFFNPSLTYFNGKNNMKIIAEIKAKGIPITEEITHFNKEGIVDNIILRDPGGVGFFIFSD